MATYGILDQAYLTDIADAIREKNGASATYTPGEMPAAIAAITTTSSDSSDTTTTTTASAAMTYDGVNFLDHDGTCLYSYSWDEIAEMAELPDLPTWTAGTEYGFEIPMTCTGWNWTLDSIQSYSGTFANVGAVYEPTDGKTHLIVHLGVNDNVCLYLQTSVDDNAVLIDWGDGSSEYTTSTAATVYSHDYDNETEGYYDITIEAAEGTASFYGASSYGAIYQYCSTTTSNYQSNDNTYRRGQPRAVYLGESITGLGDYAFRECKNLTTITLSESITDTEIGSYLFQECYSLTSISLPEGITSIGSSAFYCCYCLTSITLPEGITSIGSSAFYYCHSLTSISLPEGITSIGSSTFQGCYSLTSITLPEGITSTGTYAFYECYSLTSVSLPESITTIGQRTFMNCYALTSITLPEAITSISTYVFQHCMSLYGIDGLYISSTATTTFLYDRRLTELTNVRYIGANVSFANSPISYDSCINLFNALDPENTGTLTLSSTSYALLSDDDLAIATDKGWTVSV